MPRPIVSLLALTAFLAAAPAGADVVELQGGGRVFGKVSRDKENQRSVVAIDSPWGRIELDRPQVESLTNETPAHAEYRRRAPTVADSADSQFALALWCRDNGLADAMRDHLGRVIELSPNHERARQLLGYRLVGDRWVTREDIVASRGLVRHEGEFRTRQEVLLLERGERARQLRIEWEKRLRRWRRDLDSKDPRESNEAHDKLVGLADPAAATSLIELLSNERNAAIKQLLIRTAGAIRTRSTRGALVSIALNDTDPEARAAAVEQLAKDGRPGMAQPFVAALSSNDNAVVNHAGDALALLGTSSSIEPLIDALVTNHRRRVGNDSGGQSYSFTPTTGQFAFGGGGPKIENRQTPNPRVLGALVALSSENFAYDVPRWKAWLASNQIAERFDLRRDP